MSIPESFSPAAQSRPAPTNLALIRRLLAVGWRYRYGCLAVLAQQSLLVALTIGSLGLTGLAIDDLRHRVDPTAAAPRWPWGLEPPASWGPLAVVALFAGLVLLTALAHVAVRYSAAVTSGRLVQRIVVDLRSVVYEKLQRLSFRFYDAHRSGSIINRVAGDVQAVRMFVDGVMIQVLSVLLSLGVYLVYMFSVHVPLTLACLATTPLLWFGAALFSRKVRPMYKVASERVDHMILVLTENVQGAQVVKGFAREDGEIARFDAANRAVRDQKRGIFWTVSLFQPIMGFVTQANMIVLLAYGGWLALEGELLLGGGLFVFANLLQQFANQVGQITNIANSIQASLTGAERVFEVLDEPLEIESPQHPEKLDAVRGEIRFERVTFGYRPDKPVLEGIDLSIEPGKCVAIVGATGTGKSTLLSLVPRFYDATAGRVLVDGHDVRRLDLDALRRRIGIVFQESFLFSNTVRANIAFGDPSATDERIQNAARLAAAHEFIMALPQGYDTVIGEYGCNLSGGQRQRLALARALLMDPAILILDDATAAIDPETEHEILAAMDAAMQGRTTLITAHRLSTLRRADLIVVLEQGRVAQMGTHEELMAEEGHYRNAAVIQTLDDMRHPVRVHQEPEQEDAA